MPSLHLQATGTTVLSTRGGFVRSINVGVAGDAASTITVYDNTAGSGNIICVIDGSKVGSYKISAEAQVGVTVVVAATTAPKFNVSLG